MTTTPTTLNGPSRAALALACALAATVAAEGASAQDAHLRANRDHGGTTHHATRVRTSRGGPTAGAGDTAALGPPPSLRLEVTARPDSLRWVFALINTGSTPIELVADRRLLWLEVQPGAEPPPAPGDRTRRRARRAPRRARCLAPDRPPSEDFSPHTTVPPGGRYTEGFDLRNMCGLRLPRALVPGATLAMHYGFTGRPSAAHSIVIDEHAEPLTEISTDAPVVVPGDLAAWPPSGAPPVDRGDPRVAVTVTNAPSAATIHGVSVTVRVANVGRYPLRTFFRPGMIHFEITDPSGERISCRRPVREYAPVRDFFVRLTRGGVRETLVLGLLCPAERFTTQGVYQGQAIFESNVSAAALGFESFRGTAASPFFYFRLTRGDRAAGYQPLPTEDAFQSRPPPR